MVTKDGTTQWRVTRSMDLSPCTQESKYYSKHFVFLHLLTTNTKKNLLWWPLTKNLLASV